MIKGTAYNPKKVREGSSIEFLANLHLQQKEATYILRMLTQWMGKLERANEYANFHSKRMVEFWRKKTDDLFSDVPIENSIEPKPFKSLMQQLAEGELSYKQEVHINAA